MADEQGTDIGTDQGQQPEPQPGQGETPAPDVSGLKSALVAERRRAVDAEKLAKANADELARLREAQATDAEKALLQARREAREQADAEWSPKLRRALVTGEIKARAAGRFHDLDDVVLALADDDAITLGDDGRVGVDRALKALAERKPHWVKGEDVPRVNLGGPAGGRGGNGGGVKSSLDEMVTAELRSGRYGGL